MGKDKAKSNESATRMGGHELWSYVWQSEKLFTGERSEGAYVPCLHLGRVALRKRKHDAVPAAASCLCAPTRPVLYLTKEAKWGGQGQERMIREKNICNEGVKAVSICRALYILSRTLINILIK